MIMMKPIMDAGLGERAAGKAMLPRNAAAVNSL
jgi:hypothetical protein